MNRTWSIVAAAVVSAVVLSILAGCAEPPPGYGTEQKLILVGARRATWAVAPAINLSGQREVDGVLQADLLFEQLQQVRGLTVIPVNRTAEVFVQLGIAQVRSEEEAALVCEMLNCDGLVVPTVTIFDPYHPPKLGATLTLMGKTAPGGAVRVDARELVREARQESAGLVEPSPALVQVTGMWDAANGSVREAVKTYAAGRHDPLGPMGEREYLLSMDRYCGFVYHELITSLLSHPRMKR